MSVMQIGKFNFLQSSVTISDSPELEEFAAPLEKLLQLQRSINWWIGDVVSTGERLYGEDFFSVIPEGFCMDVIDRCASIATAIPRSCRVEDLSWSHHREVARLDPTIQKVLLRKAQLKGLTSSELRDEVKKWNKR